MSGDTTTYPTPPCIILVCSIQSWRGSNSARSCMFMKTSLSSDRSGDDDSEGGGGDPTGSPTSRPKGLSIPTTGTPGCSATAGDSGDSSATPAKIISFCWFPSYNQQQFDDETATPLFLSQLLLSMVTWLLLFST